MTKQTINHIRRLVSAFLFLTAGVFIVSNLGVFGVTNTLGMEFALTLIWGISWNMTAMHNLFYRAVSVKQAFSQSDQTAASTEIIGLKKSTHSCIKGVLTSVTAASAIAMDAYNMQEPTPSHILRLLGSNLWLGLSAYEIWLSIQHERQQEKTTTVVKPCGIRPAIFHTAHAMIYMSIGVDYATALWMDKRQSPLLNPSDLAWMRAMPNSCWLLGATNEVSRTLQILLEGDIRPPVEEVTMEGPSKDPSEVESESEISFKSKA